MPTLLSVATHPARGLTPFLESARRHRLEPLFLGWGQPWRGLGWRLKLLHHALTHHAGRIVLALDAFDSLLVRDADAIAATFRRLGHPFVIAAEANCWPDPRRAGDYPPAPSRYRFLNGGGWVAEADYARRLFDRLQVPEMADDDNDQRFLTEAFLRDPAAFRLDTRCQVFQSLWDVRNDLTLDPARGLVNRATGTQPAILHGNGGVDMTPWYTTIKERDLSADDADGHRWEEIRSEHLGKIFWDREPEKENDYRILRMKDRDSGREPETAGRQTGEKTMGPRATIVIATHNEGDALVRTVRACRATTDPHTVELLVADDASTDDSVPRVKAEFPDVRVVAHPERRGASPVKDSGARAARGEVLVFLDAHCNPEPGALDRLIADVEDLRGEAIVTPRVVALDVETWQNQHHQTGHGYRFDLDRHDSGWVALERLTRRASPSGRTFYESPGLIGCCLAVSRSLYEALGGFDPGMRIWGSEDLDFGLTAWLFGHAVLHDPEPVVGHRFQSRFERFEVPPERVLANQIRLARRHYSEPVWDEWVERARARSDPAVWPAAWSLFEADRPAVEAARGWLRAGRRHDERWYAERFGLAWPTRAAVRQPTAPAASLPAPSPEAAESDDPRERFLEHYRAPRNHGPLPGADAVGVATAPSGAWLAVSVRVAEGRIVRVGFESRRCGVAVAYASLLTERVHGRAVPEAGAVGVPELLSEFGPQAGAAEAAGLAVTALRQALARLPR